MDAPQPIGLGGAQTFDVVDAEQRPRGRDHCPQRAESVRIHTIGQRMDVKPLAVIEAEHRGHHHAGPRDVAGIGRKNDVERGLGQGGHDAAHIRTKS
jgi:hypothetical protein